MTVSYSVLYDDVYFVCPVFWVYNIAREIYILNHAYNKIFEDLTHMSFDVYLNRIAKTKILRLYFLSIFLFRSGL